MKRMLSISLQDGQVGLSSGGVFTLRPSLFKMVSDAITEGNSIVTFVDDGTNLDLVLLDGKVVWQDQTPANGSQIGDTKYPRLWNDVLGLMYSENPDFWRGNHITQRVRNLAQRVEANWERYREDEIARSGRVTNALADGAFIIIDPVSFTLLVVPDWDADSDFYAQYCRIGHADRILQMDDRELEEAIIRAIS